MRRPQATEYAPYYEKYLSLVAEENILPALQEQLAETPAFLRSIPESQGNVRHPPYTWSVKEVIGHLTDAERIFGYRALRFARADRTPLPGFDENAFVPAAQFDRVRLPALVDEWEALRRSHVCFFNNLSPAAWARQGAANDNAMTVRAVAFVLVGHTRHHLAILRKRLSNG
jgi:hypothetical protein